MSQNKVILLLGSNLGDKKNNIKIALSKIEKEIGPILISSKFLITEPLEFVSSNNFVNFATLISTHLSPIQLLKSIKKIEKDMGRRKDSKELGGYQDRLIDIDIITYSDIVFSCKELKIPHHKNLYEREFSKQLISELSFKNVNTEKHKV